ncbi:MAG: fumarylacetoacetate hydrolase [candidate division NC10 bacterium]|nr:fumarylacetoacetate hydrolase [candidate division NC10 bacterium]
MQTLWVCLVVLLMPLSAQAEMPLEGNIKAVAEAWLTKKPAPGFGVSMTMPEAAKVQERYNALIARDLGGVVGYKAGLTNPAVQKRFGYDRPIRGTLYEKMILPNGARVLAAFGARPVFEADMVAVVGDAAKLMAAKTPLEALRALKEIRPFIELPDLVYDPQVKLDGPHLLAINVGARLGVLGDPIALPATAESVAKLADMKVEVVDQTGAVLGGGKGSDVLGNPLNAVLWIAESLRAEGKALKNDELLSLGSFSALLPPRPGTTITARYTGITPTPAEVKVTFE